MPKGPFARDDEETRNPARTNDWYSLGVKTPGAMAEDVPMRLRTVRNFSTHNQQCDHNKKDENKPFNSSPKPLPPTNPSHSSLSTRQSPNPAASFPRPGTINLRTLPVVTNSTISRSVLVGASSNVCTCATETSGGSELLKFNTSAIRVLFIPVRVAGRSSNIVLRMWWIASRTVVAGAVEGIFCEMPRSGRSKSSSSMRVEASLRVLLALERGFVREWTANGEERARVVVDLRFLIPETGAEVSRNGMPVHKKKKKNTVRSSRLQSTEVEVVGSVAGGFSR